MDASTVMVSGTGDIHTMFDEATDGHETFTDSELQELLGVVISNGNASNAEERKFHLFIDINSVCVSQVTQDHVQIFCLEIFCLHL